MTAPLPPESPPGQIGEGCDVFDFACEAAQSVQSAVDGLANDATDAAAEAATSAATVWVDTPTPIFASQNEDESVNIDPTIQFIQGSLHWYTAGIAVIAIMVGGAVIAYTRRTEKATDIFGAILRMLIWTGPGLVVLGLVTALTDAFSVWIIDRSTEDFAGSLTTMLGLADLESGLGTALAIIGIAGIAWLISGFQIVLLTIRGAILAVIAGILPTAAAASSSGIGRPAYERIRNWMIAYVLYKPTAAIIYANGFISVQDDTAEPLARAWQSLSLMFLALAALPALIKVINPLTAAVASGSSGAGAGAMMAAPSGMAAMRAGRAGGAAAGGAKAAAGPTGMVAVTAAQTAGRVANQGVGGSPPPPPPSPPPSRSPGGSSPPPSPSSPPPRRPARTP